jgi:peptidoglycan glycosyltransferase
MYIELDYNMRDQIIKAQELQRMMRNNVIEKYGVENFPDLTICAKTGTAQVGGEQKSNAMFA